MLSTLRPALGTVVTYNHLHTALNLARSIRATWGEQPTIYIALVDQSDRPRPGFEDIADCHFLPVEDLGLPDFAWLALKFTPADLCCVVKPFLMLALLQQGHEQVYYCDSDFHFFNDPTALRAFRPDAELVTTPHLLSPFHRPDRMVFPAMGHIATAGMMNAGLFRLRDTTAVRHFLATWGELITAPGAFLPEFSGQSEQQAFNWVFSFLAGTVAFLDPRYNVAYWNLHERPLRWAALDGGPADRWTLAGEPIVCFHFSGFDWKNGELSRYDRRHRAGTNVNLFGLCNFYAGRLAANGAADYAEQPYRFGTLAGDVLPPRVREELRRMEVHHAVSMTDWERDGPGVLRQLNHDCGEVRAVPGYLDRLLGQRPDLMTICGAPDIFPHGFFHWVDEHLHKEYELAALYDHYCPFAFEVARLDSLARQVAARCPTLTVDTARDALMHDRCGLLQRLDAQGDALLAKTITGSNYRLPAYDPAVCLRRIYQTRADLQRHFPDPLGSNRGAFSTWARDRLAKEYLLPPEVATFAANLNPEAAVAAVLGYCQRHDLLREILRHDGFHHRLIKSLLPFLHYDIGVTVTELVLAEWWVRGRSEDERRALVRVLPDSLSAPGGESYRAWWLKRHLPADTARGRWRRPAMPGDAALRAILAEFDATDATGQARDLDTSLAAIQAMPAVRANPPLAEAFRPAPDHINLFGHFRSPIGLGSLTRGLSSALQHRGYQVRPLLLTNMTMDGPLTLDDLTPDFDFAAPRNLFVTFPHIDFDLFKTFPAQFFAGRESSAYLAWEQRDFHPGWADKLAKFDRLFALSRFSAEAIARGTGRPCEAIPCVVEVDSTAAAAYSRQDFDLPEDAFVVGMVMDATSSLERKNPLGAVEAVVRAFAGQRNVVLALKISGGAHARYQAAVMAVVDKLTAAGIDYRLYTTRLPKAQVDGLIRACDVYLSLHRAEGFGYTIAEAMLLGVPVVASAYSGNMDFMSADNAFAVPCQEVMLTRAEGPFQLGTVWGDPDLDAAAAMLRAVRDDPPAAKARAAEAKMDATRLLSVEAVAQRLRQLFP